MVPCREGHVLDTGFKVVLKTLDRRRIGVGVLVDELGGVQFGHLLVGSGSRWSETSAAPPLP